MFFLLFAILRWSPTSSKTAPEKLVTDQEQPANIVHQNGSTNCPPGLRKLNLNSNHVHSPYWLNKNRSESSQDPNSEAQRFLSCEETIAESERSNIDHGFESFNGKSSSSDEPLTPARVSWMLYKNLIGLAQ